jgi:hypothetical protein
LWCLNLNNANIYLNQFLPGTPLETAQTRWLDAEFQKPTCTHAAAVGSLNSSEEKLANCDQDVFAALRPVVVYVWPDFSDPEANWRLLNSHVQSASGDHFGIPENEVNCVACSTLPLRSVPSTTRKSSLDPCRTSAPTFHLL